MKKVSKIREQTSSCSTRREVSTLSKGGPVQKLTVHRSVGQIADRYFSASKIDEVRKFPRKHISKRRLTSRRRFTGGRVNNSISRSRVSANPLPRRHSFSDKLINRVHQSERTCVMAVPKTFVTQTSDNVNFTLRSIAVTFAANRNFGVHIYEFL